MTFSRLPNALKSLATLLTAALVALALAGCSVRTLNDPLGDGPDQPAYDFGSRLPGNDERLFVVLAFSGGGTRAAALSYGVMDALRNKHLMLNGRSSPLIEQVDVITAVSGGSYTAAYYGLFGDRLFDDFRSRFLERHWSKTYGWLLANPLNMARITSSDLNRTDLMADFLNDEIFDGKTFADLSLGPLPFIIVNATDLNNSLTFSFIQQQFDMLCSELNSYPVANAVMASSTVPPAFAPVRLRNYSGCEARHKPWIGQALEARDLLSREYAVAQGLSRYLDPDEMSYLNLADGGITDNLGVRGSMMSPIAHHGDVKRMAGAFSQQALDKVEKVLVLVVNAQVHPPYPWAISGNEPGTYNTLAASFDAAFNTLTTENISQARREFLMWENNINRNRPADKPPVKVHFANLTFNQVEDPEKRAQYHALPTAALSPDQVNALINVAAELLDQSKPLHQFVQDVNTTFKDNAKTEHPL